MFIIKSLSKLPFPVLYAVSDLIFFMCYYVIGYRKSVVVQNIKNSFPEFDQSTQSFIVKKFYKNLSDVLVETLKVLSIQKKDLKQRVLIKNPELLEKHYKQHQSVIVATSHQCNWEWLLLGCSIQIPYEVDAVYKHIKDDFSRNLIMQIRGRFGAHLIEKNQVNRSLVQRKDKVRLIALVADQSPAVAKDRHWTKFLNQDTAFYKGIEKIAKMMQMPVLYVAMRRLKRGFYEIEFTELSAKSRNIEEGVILERYVQAAEETIKKNPADWLWSHKRWKMN